MRIFSSLLIPLALISLTGCIMPPDNEEQGDTITTQADGGGAAPSSYLTALIHGINEGFLGLENNGQQYSIYEDGLFTSQVKPVKSKVKIFANPTGSHCELFDYNNTYWNVLAHCLDNMVPNVNTVVPVSPLGWTYAISDHTRVLYSPEHILWNVDANETNITVTKSFTPYNVGVFFNNGDLAEEMQYVVADTGIVADNDPDALQQGYYELLTNSGITSSISETYRHRIDELTTVEYAITTDNMTTTDLLRRLAQSLRDRFVSLGEYSTHPEIMYIPTPFEGDVLTTSFRLGVSLWPSGNSVLYMLRATPSSDLGENEHFPTPDLKAD